MSSKRTTPPSLPRRHSWPLSSLESAAMHESIAEVHDVYTQYVKQRPQLQRTIASINELDRKLSRIWYECAAVVLALCILSLLHFGFGVEALRDPSQQPLPTTSTFHPCKTNFCPNDLSFLHFTNINDTASCYTVFSTSLSTIHTLSSTYNTTYALEQVRQKYEAGVNKWADDRCEAYGVSRRQAGRMRKVWRFCWEGLRRDLGELSEEEGEVGRGQW